jgi:hypothetical protein
MSTAAHVAPSAKPSEPRGMPPPTEQPLELDESPLLDEPATVLDEPAVPDAPPAATPPSPALFGKVRVHCTLAHVAPSLAHLQSAVAVHQPS